VVYYRRKADKLQASIGQHLRSVGCEVFYTHFVGVGFPDMVVYNPSIGLLRLIEVKTEKEKLAPNQEAFFKRFGSACAIVHNNEEAEAALMVRIWPKGRSRV
jgi:hypothetical protein